MVELTSGDWEGIYADNSGLRPRGGRRADRRALEHPGRGGAASTSSRCGAGPSETKAPSATSTSRRRDRPPTSPTSRPSASRRSPGPARIAGATVSAAADPKATAVTLTANLPAGRTKLKAWFADADGKGLCGAFFVTVKRPAAPVEGTNEEKN